MPRVYKQDYPHLITVRLTEKQYNKVKSKKTPVSVIIRNLIDNVL